MRSAELKSISCQDGQEVSFSSAVTIELMQAAFSKGACFRFKVKGLSMVPFIKDNDIVTLSPICFSRSNLGRIVACICPIDERFFVHRIVAREGDRYLIKGDNCFESDLMQRENILGCVIKIERGSKAIFFSLGFERAVIAFLSKLGLLFLCRMILNKICKLKNPLFMA